MDEPAEKLHEILVKFVDHVNELIEEEDPAGNGFHREYRDLREIAAENKAQEKFPALWGKQPYNAKKNRYRDIVPFDNTRVILKEIEGVEGSDYINASFIQNVHKSDAYIASQGPLPHIVDDFWRMIWENKVKVILMACKEVEAGKKKCARYWPENINDTEEFGNIKVRLQGLDWLAEDCAERTMEVFNDKNERRIVVQYHYTGWPDHGIPDDIDVILTMILKMREIRSHDKDFAPVVVHCSAGCGRTGTICAVDYAWEVLKCGKLTKDFSLYEIVKSMREQRQSMIQTPDQYEMAHRCVRELFQQHLTVLDKNIYANFEPKQDDEYYNVELTGDVKETVDGQMENAAFKISDGSTKTTSILLHDAEATVEMYSTPEAFSELDKAVPEISSHPPLKPKPNLVLTKTNDKVEEQQKGKQGYENVFERDKYENMMTNSKETSANQNIEKTSKLSSSQKSEAPLPLLRKQEEVKKEVTNQSTAAAHQFSSGHSGPQFVAPQSGPQFSEPSKLQVSHRKQSVESAPKNKTIITVGSSTAQSRVSYIENIDQSVPNNSINKPKRSPVLKKRDMNTTQGPMFSSLPTDLRSSKGELPPDNRVTDTSNVHNNHPHPAPSTAVYSEVKKSPKFSQSLNEAPKVSDENAYECISGDTFKTRRSSDTNVSAPPNNSGLYSEVDSGDMNTPPIPNRGYKDGEGSTHTIHGMTTLERKSGNSGLTKFLKIKNSTEDVDTDTSHIPGFNKRYDKKPGGPKEKPTFWKKILK